MTTTTTTHKATTVKGMAEQINVLSTQMNLDPAIVAKKLKLGWGKKLYKPVASEVLDEMAAIYTRRKNKVAEILALGGSAHIAMTNKELHDLLIDLSTEKEEEVPMMSPEEVNELLASDEQAPVVEAPTVDKEALIKEAAEANAARIIKEAEEKAKIEQERKIKQVVEFINTRLGGSNLFTIYTPLEVLEGTYKEIIAKDITLYNQDQVSKVLETATKQTTEAVSEEVATRMEEAVTPSVPDNAPTVDVGSVYDAIKEKITVIHESATKAYADKQFDAGDALMKEYSLLTRKLNSLSEKHGKEIFVGDRAKNIIDNARIAIAEGLRISAEATNKYGHKSVTSLIELANDILNGTVKVAEIALKGGEAILKTGIDVAGKAGHVVVDAGVDAQNLVADLVDKK